jgi:hypothetical protein
MIQKYIEGSLRVRSRIRSRRSRGRGKGLLEME